ncbi:MAG TPA: hypothetical protein VEW48_20410 [Thermoanaerobaculia bacterium]|nr:hypothetical protein [Thermoanaerobaculia bacterium]
MLTRITSMVLALGFLLSAGAFAFDRPGALGPGGEVYLTQVGPYGVLFPKGKSYPANNVVLTLEVSRSGGAADRVMVPGTEGAEVESSPFVVFEETSKSLYLLWQTKSDALVNRLILRTFKDGSFGPPIEVRTSLFNAAMSAPQVAVTRDEFFVPTADGGTATVHRTLLHLIWWEESPAGNEVHYAPITLIEGIYTGWHPVYSLNDFDRSPDDSAAANEALAQLYRSPRIQTGRNDHSVVISFADERNGRLTVLDVSLLPGEISYIADKIRSHIIDIGRKKPTASEIADKIRSHIIDIGRLQPQVVSFLSNDVYQHILAVGPQFEGNGDYNGLADEVSDYATRTASTMLENGRLGEGTDSPEILRLAADDNTDEIGAPRLQVRGVFSQLAPHTAAAPTTVFASEDGKAVLVAWDAVNQIRYRESSAEGWGDVLGVTLSTDLTREQAYEFLEQRLRR